MDILKHGVNNNEPLRIMLKQGKKLGEREKGLLNLKGNLTLHLFTSHIYLTTMCH
jgi:hypothetical protein